MTLLNDQALEAVESGRLVHLTTLNADGSPQTTVVWTGLDGDDLVIASLHEYTKIKNVRRDGRVTVSLETGGATNGLPNYLVIEGTATVEEGDASEWLQHLARRYIGPDAVFPTPEQARPGCRVVVTPTKVRGNGPWRPAL